ncbi:MAG: GNAT family N-acetyltransferase [Candidatus Merdivicinus sp.]|jgi:L-amino acid N-acyltransferase YncA
MPPILRSASLSDAAGILDVYAPYIRDTAITFEYTVPSLPEFRQRIQTIQQRFPYLVCEEDGQLLGYAYASSHHERAAYAWNAELSIYVRPQCQRRGIAGALCRSVIEILRLLGYRSLYSRITIPNPASLALHRSLGFREEGRYTATGFKLGQWRDMAKLSLVLAPRQGEPEPVRPVSALSPDLVGEIFARQLSKIH